ncbi:branched-chain amino acid aminotransferase [Trinickia sp. EG282A]|uniref:branched-chain amino acid aminotransferase n=1 Tax=Trinickia sp. EG282A TaxID=3237013 RepID=UPI0034D17268
MSNTGSASFLRELNPNRVEATKREALLENPGFGRVFTDHMVTIRYSEGRGWYDAKVVAHGPFSFDPATLVLHYAQEIFEGMKAYRLPDGGAALFRPDANARRFRHSAERLAMPALPEQLFVDSVRELVRVDREWIPRTDGSALYLRPFMIATEAVLGMKPSPEYWYCVVATPVGSYFKGGASAVTLWVSENYTRAAPGGTGDAKCGGNYAASLAAQAEAIREGCDQVVFLDAVERRWVEELGGMNVFFVFADGSIQTPPLTGTILPGITRASLITLARDLGLTVREEPYAIDEWQADAQRGKLVEAFACGTAAVVTPIGKVKGRTHEFTIGDGNLGLVTARLKSALLDIQNGRAPDHYGWLDRLF